MVFLSFLPSEAWKFYSSRSNLTCGNTHLDRDGTHGSNALQNVYYSILLWDITKLDIAGNCIIT